MIYLKPIFSYLKIHFPSLESGCNIITSGLKNEVKNFSNQKSLNLESKLFQRYAFYSFVYFFFSSAGSHGLRNLRAFKAQRNRLVFCYLSIYLYTYIYILILIYFCSRWYTILPVGPPSCLYKNPWKLLSHTYCLKDISVSSHVSHGRKVGILWNVKAQCFTVNFPGSCNHHQ